MLSEKWQQFCLGLNELKMHWRNKIVAWKIVELDFQISSTQSNSPTGNQGHKLQT